MEAIVLFAGAGGVSEGLRNLGVTSVGVENNTAAVATSRANGHSVICEDVLAISPSTLVDGHSPFILQASPPCQGLSVAGIKSGRKDIDNILLALEGHDVEYNHLASYLIVDMLRWIKHEPDVIMLEQVVSIKPIWDWYANYLRSKGYNVFNEIVHMEQYGLAQTRSRAILIASKSRLNIPGPIYAKFNGRKPRDFAGCSMQDVIPTWAGSEVGFPRLYDRGDSVVINGIKYRGRDFRDTSLPSFAITEKARSWKKAGMFLDIDEVKLLQGFSAEYQFIGARTSQYLQLGNAVPPQIVQALLKYTKLVD